MSATRKKGSFSSTSSTATTLESITTASPATRSRGSSLSPSESELGSESKLLLKPKRPIKISYSFEARPPSGFSFLKSKFAKLSFEEQLHQLGKGKLQVFKNNSELSLDELEQEFKFLCEMTEDDGFWKTLSKEQKLALEQYKLSIMKALEAHLITHHGGTVVKPLEPPLLPSKKMVALFVIILVLEVVPALWGGYLGGTELLAAFAPWLSNIAVSTITLALCGIEALLYYAVMGPLLKESLGIDSVPFATPLVEAYNDQLEAVKNIDTIMTVNNKMSVAEYEQYRRLNELFHRQMDTVKDYKIYVKENLQGVDQIVGKAIVVVGDEVYFVKNKAIVSPQETLTERQRKKLSEQPRNTDGVVKRTSENSEFLDGLVQKLTSKASLRGNAILEKFQEHPVLKGIRWALGTVNTALNMGGGYFFAMALMTGTPGALSLMTTPLGWGIVAFIVLGQVALRYAVRSNGMLHLLNPTAQKHETVRGALDDYKPQPEKLGEILDEKKKHEANEIAAAAYAHYLNEILDEKEKHRTNERAAAVYARHRATRESAYVDNLPLPRSLGTGIGTRLSGASSFSLGSSSSARPAKPAVSDQMSRSFRS